MRIRSTALALAAIFGLTWAVLAQQQTAEPSAAKAYEAKCATCHGPKMTGATGPAILAYVRYHTDAELTARLGVAHASRPVQLTDEELKQVLADVRALAGTDPAMASGGYTGMRGRGGAGRATGAAPTGAAGTTGASAAAPAGGGGRGRGRGASALPTGPVTINLAGGRTLTGRLMAQSEFDATLLSEGKFYFLSREGDQYRERALEPKLNWETYHGSLAAGRFSPMEQINIANIKNLSVAWILPLTTSPRWQATPVVADGVMYMTGWNEIYAIDATTGRQLWYYSQPRTEGILGDAGMGSHRGAGVSADRVYMVTDHAHVLAFNRFTGEKLWDVEMGDYKEGHYGTAPPLFVGDLLIQGVSGGDEGIRGFLDAYNAKSGERVWRFWTIPKRGEPGSETWIGQAIDHGCGATWQPGSYDPQLDLIYWGTGNPCPDHNREERMGDNLYTASVVALEAKTGKLKWYYQFTPNDTNDWDATQPMVLVDEMWQGRPRKLLLHGNRNGMFYVLDRTTGEFLLGSNLSTKVTWNKGFTREGKPIVDPGMYATREGVALCPGPNGGANWPDVSYSPITKLFYVRVADSCGVSVANEDPLTNNRWFGEGPSPNPPVLQAKLAALQEGYAGGNFIRAMDPFTGKKVWDYPVTFGRSGVLSTGGGLVFLGGVSGLVALDAKTGKPVWNINLNQGTVSTPMTYMVGGKQYIALPGTNSIVAYAIR